MSLDLNYAVSDNLQEANSLDNILAVRFYLGQKLDADKSAEAGRPIYKSREYVRIATPGDKLNIVDRPVIPADRNRFAVQYAKFKNDKEQETTGTPLVAWPTCTEAQRKELEYFNVKTVEQLANLADSFASSMMGIMSLKAQAKRFIDQAKENAITEKLNARLAERDAQLAEFMAKMEDMQEKLAALESAKPATKAAK